MNSFFLFTSYLDRETLIKALEQYATTDDGSTIKFSDYALEITSDDGYFMQQREGMMNFFSTLMNPSHMEVHSKFLMHLASCVQGYKIIAEDLTANTDVINTLIEELSGVIFTPDMTFYTKDWQIIINSNGDCDVSDYNVQMSAETYDSLHSPESNSESENRKQQTIQYLQSLGIKTLDSLPITPPTYDVTYRDEDEVVTRILCLAVVAVKGELRSNEIPYSVMNKYGIEPHHLSPKELAFMQDETVEEQDFVNAIWRYESLNVLLWAMGYVEDLHFPSDIVDVSTLTNDIRQCDDFMEFSAIANMRDMTEILYQLDLTYRLHWACTDARINGENSPENVNPSVVYERHYALNWLLNLYNEDWDNIPTNT